MPSASPTSETPTDQQRVIEKTRESFIGDGPTRFQLDALRAVAELQTDEEGPHGLAIKRFLESELGCKVHPSRLYPNLDTLVEQRVLFKTTKDQRTNEYTLTRTGQEMLAERCEQYEAATRGLE